MGVITVRSLGFHHYQSNAFRSSTNIISLILILLVMNNYKNVNIKQFYLKILRKEKYINSLYIYIYTISEIDYHIVSRRSSYTTRPNITGSRRELEKAGQNQAWFSYGGGASGVCGSGSWSWCLWGKLCNLRVPWFLVAC